MRWFWFDRYTEFVSGRRATAVKVVSLSEEHLHDHFPGRPIMPNTLIGEGLAQVAGLLVSEYYDFRQRVILAKFAKLDFQDYAAPGDTLTYRAEILQIKQDGAAVRATSHIGERLQAEAEIFFVHLSDRSSQRPLFAPRDFLNWLKTIGVFEVGVDAQGEKLMMPPDLARLDAEESDQQQLVGQTAP
jgi:3-hydroxyacyl-[acyl-carrier-protein] dehydratase